MSTKFKRILALLAVGLLLMGGATACGPSDADVASNVSANHYKVVFKPSTIIPDPEVR